MDSVYSEYLAFYNKPKIMVDNEIKLFSDFIKPSIKCLDSFQDKKISVSKISENRYFVSNMKSKGFITEKPASFVSINGASKEYEKIHNSFGRVLDVFGFEDPYFSVLTELFANSKVGLGDYEEKFLKKSKSVKQFKNINIDTVYIFATDGGGNIFVITPEDKIFLYALDIDDRNYIPVADCPKNTFYTIPNVVNLNDYVKKFVSYFFEQ